MVQWAGGAPRAEVQSGAAAGAVLSGGCTSGAGGCLFVPFWCLSFSYENMNR